MANLIGLFDYAFELHEDWPFAGTKEKQQKKMETKWGQLGDWTKEMWKFMNPFTPIRPGYDSHLWTIQYEFRNSIVLFAALVGVAKLKPRIRLGLVSALYLYCVVVEQGDIALFLAGIVLAEFLLIRDDSKKTLPSAEAAKPEKEGKQSLQAKAAWTVVLIIGLHLLSYPAWNYKTSWGYVTITQLTPSFIGNVELSWQRVGAAVLLLALCGSDYLRKPFSTPLAVYLGKISFPLYIIHGPIVHILGYRLVPLFWNIVGNATLFQYELGLVLAFLVQMVVVVWLADLVMRTVDTPSVRLGRTLQTWWSV
jgi:peptidoglycan/LPS O-acetylase OafA/YrhL